MAPDEKKRPCLCCKERPGIYRAKVDGGVLCAPCKDDPAIKVSECLHGKAPGGA